LHKAAHPTSEEWREPYWPELEFPEPVPEPPLLLLDGLAPLVSFCAPLTLPAPEPPCEVLWANEVVAKLAANAPIRAAARICFFMFVSMIEPVILNEKSKTWFLAPDSGRA
jgi:hypothetical protein